MIIDLRSDTVTKPTPEMLEAMFNAEVGDDVFGEDPTVNALEEKAAALFGKEAGLFCPSGSMTNQIAIKTHTNPADEIICDESAHVYRYEGGGPAFNSGVSVALIENRNGIIRPEDVLSKIKPEADWLVRSKLVVIENSCNMTGGNYYTLEQIKPLSATCKENNLRFHLDGARVFNALTETGDDPVEVGQYFDSISFCLSKGLGCPVGSLLLGSSDFIKEARRYRKIFGGGMRQAGHLAAAGIYALNNHIPLLKEDHKKAKMISNELKQLSFIEEVRPAFTNIIIFKLDESAPADAFLAYLDKNNIKALSVAPQTIRFVVHIDISDDMLKRLVRVMQQFSLEKVSK